MTTGKPYISIITPVLNAEITVRETLESVVCQCLERTEHLLIDAKSTDQTLTIAASYPHLRIISEPDQGIYDGMNKGASLARGEWLLFLQADDWLPRGTLEAYLKAIQKYPNAEIICGSAEAVKNDSEGWRTVWTVRDDERNKLTVENIALGEPMINARLIRRDAFVRLGGFSLDYSLASDRDFLLRASEADLQQVEIPSMSYRYRWHSGSSTMTEGNNLTHRLSMENISIARNHLTCTQGSERMVLKKWHTRLTVQAAMNALEACRFKGVISALKEGSTLDPFWIMNFFTELVRSLPGFLARGGKTRSQLLDELASK